MRRSPWMLVQLAWQHASFGRRALLGAVLVLVVVWVGGSLQKRRSAELEEVLSAARQQHAEQVARAQRPAEASSADQARAGVMAFRAALGRGANLERDLQVIFDAARAQGLALPEGRYKAVDSRVVDFQQLELDLPVKGSYRAIRRFAEGALLKLPHAALADVRFQRKSASTAELEAQLRFVLYLDTVERLTPEVDRQIAATEASK